MTVKQSYIFVLWGNRFDEVSATLFIAELRRAGALVKLVGLHGPEVAGAHGVKLVSDLSLTEAGALAAGVLAAGELATGELATGELNTEVLALIFPCQVAHVRHAFNDPRLARLCRQAAAQGAVFVVQNENVIEHSGLAELALTDAQRYTYRDADMLAEVGPALALTLAPKRAER